MNIICVSGSTNRASLSLKGTLRRICLLPVQKKCRGDKNSLFERQYDKKSEISSFMIELIRNSIVFKAWCISGLMSRARLSKHSLHYLHHLHLNQHHPQCHHHLHINHHQLHHLDQTRCYQLASSRGENHRVCWKELSFLGAHSKIFFPSHRTILGACIVQLCFLWIFKSPALEGCCDMWQKLLKGCIFQASQPPATWNWHGFGGSCLVILQCFMIYVSNYFYS